MLEQFVDNLSEIIDCHNFYTCVAGDFNLSNIDWNIATQSDSYRTSSLNLYFIDFLNINNYRQCNFITNSMNKILDLVIVDFPSCSVSRALDVLIKEDPLHPS